MIDEARDEGIETVWDRLAAQQPQCGYCALGLSCRNCAMGPCRIDPFGEGPQKGVCGADADVIVARNLGRTIAAGSSSHSDHGRDILEMFRSPWPTARPPATRSPTRPSCARLAAELGVDTEGRSPEEVAPTWPTSFSRTTAAARSRCRSSAGCPRSAGPGGRQLGITPRGIDRENVEMLHRTHMGVDNDYVNILLHALRTGLSDGWGGSMIATELSDVMFGTPTPVMSEVNLGRAARPTRSTSPCTGTTRCCPTWSWPPPRTPSCSSWPGRYGATGINVVGLCCTGNELLMRRGVPMAGNHLMQELVLITGALEAMVVDYQCIMPSVVDVAKCYHTKIISTSDKAKFTGATHVSFDPQRGAEIAREIVRMAVEAYPDRNQERVRIPVEPVRMMGGLLGGGDPRRARRDPQAAGRRHRRGHHPGRGGRGRVQQPEAPPGLRAHRADPPAHRERRPGPRHRVRGGGQRQGRTDGARVRGHGRAGTAGGVRVARASRRCCTWVAAWTTAGSWCWPPRWPTTSASTSTSCRWPAPPRSGTRRRRWPSAPTWWQAGSPPCSACSPRSSAARTWSICWPTASTTWSAPSSSVEPDPAEAALLIRRHIEAKREGLGLPAVDVDDDASAGGPAPVAGAGSEGLSAMCDTCGGHGARARRRHGAARTVPGPGSSSSARAASASPRSPPLLARLFARRGLGGDRRRRATSSAIWRPHSGSARWRRRPSCAVADAGDYVEEKTGARPGEGAGGMLRLNPDTADVVDRLRRPRPRRRPPPRDGRRSGRPAAGASAPRPHCSRRPWPACTCTREDVVLMDTHAGVEHFGRALARGFDHAVVVVDPTVQRRAGGHGDGPVWPASWGSRRSTWWSTASGSHGRPATGRSAHVDRLGGFPFASIHGPALRRARPRDRARGRRPARGLGAGRRHRRARSRARPGPAHRDPVGVGRPDAGCRHRHRPGRDHRGRDAPPARPDRLGGRTVRRAIPAVLAAGHGRPFPDRPGRTAVLEGPRRRRAPRDRRASRDARVVAIDTDNREVVLGDGTRIGLRRPRHRLGQPPPRPARRGRAAWGARLQVAAHGRPSSSAGCAAARRAARSSSGNGFIGVELSLLLRRSGRGRHGHRPSDLGHAAGARPDGARSVAEAALEARGVTLRLGVAGRRPSSGRSVGERRCGWPTGACSAPTSWWRPPG